MSKSILDKLELTQIGEFKYVKQLGGGSGFSCLYSDGTKLTVFKFLIAPRNNVERDRFICEYLALRRNRFLRESNSPDSVWNNIFPVDAYPVPLITHELVNLGDSILYFGYKHESGELLSDYIKKVEFSFEQKIYLLHRIASALNYFSHLHFSHRDLHPENILVMPEPDMDSNKEHPSPKVKILDLGFCINDYGFQRIEFHGEFVEGVQLDIDAISEDNNKRCLSSFTSMPPDFLTKGANTKNYDSWSFGVFAYNFLFDEHLFPDGSLEKMHSLLSSHVHPLYMDRNAWPLTRTDYPLFAILESLLHIKGEERSDLGSITKLFYWYRHEKDRFQNVDFIKRVIKNGGNDPDHNPLDDIY